MVMDPLADTKKRKLEENHLHHHQHHHNSGSSNSNGAVMNAAPPCEPLLAADDSSAFGTSEPADKNNHTDAGGMLQSLSRADISLMVDLLSKEDLVHIVVEAAQLHRDVLDGVRELADRDPAHRKIFVRGLGWETDTVSLRDTFSEFGELEEAIAIMDRNTGKSRGYGFVTFKHIDGAINALKEPSKRIDGRISVCQLATQGSGGTSQPPQDLASRKIYVGNVPLDWPVDELLSIFTQYGDIEEGPLGLDKQVGKVRGFALFIYKSAESAKRALEEPVKNVNGHQLFCKLAIEGAKQRSAIQHGNGQPEMAELGNTGNQPYGHFPAGPPQNMMAAQAIPYNQNTDPGMHTGLTQSQNLNPNMVMPMQNRPIGNNSSMPSAMSGVPHQWQGAASATAQVGAPMGMAPHDPYVQQQTVPYPGAYASVGTPVSSYNTGTVVSSQTPVVQGQYGMPSYQSQHQHLSGPYQNAQSQQQVAIPSSGPRVPQMGGVPTVPYYGM